MYILFNIIFDITIFSLKSSWNARANIFFQSKIIKKDHLALSTHK